MRKSFTICIAAAITLVPLSALAEDAPAKSERAMSPDSAKEGAAPGAKSERGMNADAGKPGESPNPKSERAMDPATSEK